jgi:DNA repair photolyase
MFPTTHDITPALLTPALRVIRRLLDSGNELLIVSKPHLECIEAICRETWANQEQVTFRFTIGAFDPDVLSYWEPGAPGFYERLACLKFAYASDFKTSVSAEPLLDYDHAPALAEKLLPFITDSLWIGKLNNIRQRVKVENARDREEVSKIEANQTDSKIKALYEALRHEPKIKWKESIKKVVGLPLATRPGEDT